MKRLVYAPKVSAFVKTDKGIVDVSPYITAGSVNRKLDQISAAQLTLRNPEKRWTEPGPTFHPMDPITVLLTRLRDAPIQVFTGYLDATPYLQLKPGTVTLRASCTLKKLLYTYFDPGLPFFEEFLANQGWQVLEGRGIVNASAEKDKAAEAGHLTDSGFGRILYNVLKDVGHWPEETIYIEKIPPKLIETVTQLFVEQVGDAKRSNEELRNLLTQIIGTASLGSGNPGPVTSSYGTGDWVRVGATIDPTRGQAPTFSDHNGMSFAELLVAGGNAGLKSEALYRVLGIPEEDSYRYGMPMGTAIEIRLPGKTQSFKIWKNDVGSGQAGNTHYKIDLHQGIADALGWVPNQDVEVRKI